jgi:replicative DNA helicase
VGKWILHKVLAYLVKLLAGVDKDTLQMVIDRVVEVDLLDYLPGEVKKNEVIRRLGAVADEIVHNYGTSALNFLVELAVRLMKARLV